MVNKTGPIGKRKKKATAKPTGREKGVSEERRIRIQKALYKIAEAASAVTDMRSFYKRLHKIVGELMYAGNFFIALYDEQSDLITWPYYVDTVDVTPLPPIALSKQHGATGWILRHGKTLADVDGSVARTMKAGEIELVGTHSDGIGIPLKNDGKTIGVLVVQSYEANIRYTLQDIEILSFVAQHISTALTRARAIEETRQRNTELQVINRVQEGLASNLDIQSIYTLVGDELREIFAADTTFIAFRDDTRDLLHVHYYADRVLQRSFTRPYRTGIAELIIDSGNPLLLRNELEQQERGALHVVSPGAEKDLNQSVLGAPIFRNGRACGAVSVQSYQVNAFGENDLRLLQTLTNSMSVALENARLFSETQRLLKETEQRNAELAIINSVQQGLASKLDMQAIYELIGETVRKVFNVQVMDIVAYDPAANLLSMPYSYEKGDRSVFSRREPYGFRLHVINSCEPFLINENFVELALQYNNPLLTGAWPKSALFVPLLLNGAVKGIISIQDLDREHAYSAMDVRLLQTLANSMSVALENAQLFDESQQRNAELAIINRVQEGLASKLDMQSIYELVGEKIRETFNAQVVNIVTYDRATQLMHGRYFFEDGEVLPGITLPAFGFRKYVVETCQPIVINRDMPRWMEEYDNPVMRGIQSKSAIFIPMRVGEETMGVISLQNNDQENAFTEADVRLLTTLANSMSVALENARLWEQEKLYRKALERELEIGREIQAGFLPEALPRVEGWEIAASLMSAREVAGDFYDAFELPDGNIGLVIADVCDKGVGAALFMTLFRSLIRITANQEYFEPSEHVTALPTTEARLQRAMTLTNNYIAETHQDSGMFATIFFGILDPHAGKLIYINGGHEPPLIVRSSTVRESLRKTGPAVGALLDCQFEVCATQLNPGEMFFAFTDGAPEAKNPGGEFFGRERLLDVLQSRNNSSHELVKTMEAELLQYMDRTTQFDDIALLAVQRIH